MGERAAAEADVLALVGTTFAPTPTTPSIPPTTPQQALSEVLEESEQRGTISAAQHHALMADLSARLQPLLAHPG